MFTPAQIENLMFLDIETVPMAPTYEELSPRMREMWDAKVRRYQRAEPEKEISQLFLEKAGIHAEFGRVVCISCGLIRFADEGKPDIRLKSYFDTEEKVLLEAFGRDVDHFTRSREGRSLCAHNGREFDFPYLGRRYLIHGLEIPYVLRIQGKKPWEVSFVDTMELWKFGDYKAYTSLNLLSAVLDVPSPKDDIDGSQVRAVYWEENDIERIKNYCEKDVLTTAQVLLRMSRLPLIDIPQNHI